MIFDINITGWVYPFRKTLFGERRPPTRNSWDEAAPALQTVIEDFCFLPRVFRDVAVNELWEGPCNVFLMQVFRDLGLAAAFYPPDRFLRDLLTGAPEADIADLGRRARKSTADPPFGKLDRDSRRRVADREEFGVDVFHVYQETVLQEVGSAPIVGPGKMSLPDLWE